MDIFSLRFTGLFVLGLFLFKEHQAVGQTSPPSDQTFTVGVEFYGWAPYPNRSTGGRFVYAVADQLELELVYVQSEQTLLLSDYRYQEGLLRATMPLGGVFQWGVGVGVRELELRYDVNVVGDSGDESVTSVNELNQVIVVGGHLGARIDLTDNISLGSDLVSVSQPVHWLKREEEFPENAAIYEEDSRTIPFVASGYTQNIHLLRTFIGVRF